MSRKVRNRIRAVYRSARPSIPDNPIDAVLDEFARTYPDAFFIQVGAHDGVVFDPLRRHVLASRWSGVLVEPVPDIFDRLRENYGDVPRLAFENAAIAERTGSREFYYVPASEDDELPFWYDALGSFLKETLIRGSASVIPDIANRVQSMEVRCMTFDMLCERHGVTHVDLVQIDTEGYDYEVIKMINLDRLQPKVIMFEHKLLDPIDRNECLDYLQAHGYDVIGNTEDALCLRLSGWNARDRRLRRLWRRLH
jgi:FkbM family methyltransferase